MSLETRKPVLAGTGLLNIEQLPSKFDDLEHISTTPDLQILQTRFVLDRLGHWQHISVPVARVIAELAFAARRDAA